MSPSLSFLLGLAVLVVADYVSAPLPGQAFPYRYLWFAAAIALPIAVASWNGRRLRVLALVGEPPGPALRARCRLQTLTVPAGMYLMVDRGGLVPFAESVGGDSHAGQFALLLGALLALELPLRIVERRTVHALEARRASIPGGLASGWSRMTAFVIVPILLFALALDALGADRELAVFAQGTSVGTTLGLLAAVASLSFVLPILFRWVLPTRRTLPWQVADDVRGAASQLGFPPSQVLALDTRHRMVNAALVGPLPWPRYLVLTDGILACLDGAALRGVVAHEVGHARAGHPGWLMVLFAIVPILLLQPIATSGLEDWPPEVLIGAGAALALVALFGVRWLMHRFEFEADQLSAAALGGALPCIRALRRVGDLFPTHRTRRSLRHPSEEQRVQSLLTWEANPAYRLAFARRGRIVRIGIAVLALLALTWSAFAHARTWPLDAVVLRFYTGDFAGAEAALAGLDPEQLGPQAVVARALSEEVRIAVSLMGAGGRWDEVAPELADRAWRNGVALTASQGPKAARPWLALAVLGPDADPVRETAWLWSEAVTDDDGARAAELATHLATLADVPAVLLAAVK